MTKKRGLRARTAKTRAVGDFGLRTRTKDQAARTPGVADRVAPPGQDAIRRYLEAFLCPFCGAGPFTTVAGHTVRMHGIDRNELRDLAGIGYTKSISPAEFREAKSRAMRERGGLPEPAREAQRTKPRKGDPNYTPPRSNDAKREAARQSFQKRVDGIRAQDEYRDWTDAEIASLIGKQNAETRRSRLEPVTREQVARLEEALRHSDLLIREIADREGVHVRTVKQIAKRNGIAYDGHSRAPYAKQQGARDMSKTTQAWRQTAAEARQERLEAWAATDHSWQALVTLAASLGLKPQHLQNYLHNHGVADLPDGRLETTKRRANYPPPRPCSQPDCPLNADSRGMCNRHYKQHMRALRRAQAAS